VKAQVEDAFNHFGSNEIYKEQFIKYFLNKGMKRKNIDELWMNAYRMNIILIGVKPIVSEKKPLDILGHVTVFKLVGREEE